MSINIKPAKNKNSCDRRSKICSLFEANIKAIKFPIATLSIEQHAAVIDLTELGDSSYGNFISMKENDKMD